MRAFLTFSLSEGFFLRVPQRCINIDQSSKSWYLSGVILPFPGHSRDGLPRELWISFTSTLALTLDSSPDIGYHKYSRKSIQRRKRIYFLILDRCVFAFFVLIKCDFLRNLTQNGDINQPGNY